VALARGYAKGTVFAIANSEAAIRILWEIYPHTKPTGKDEAIALRDDLITLEAHAKNWRYEQVDGKRWGDNFAANYQAYLDRLLDQGIIKTKTDAKDIITNELLDEAINFNENALINEDEQFWGRSKIFCCAIATLIAAGRLTHRRRRRAGGWRGLRTAGAAETIEPKDQPLQQ